MPCRPLSAHSRKLVLTRYLPVAGTPVARSAIAGLGAGIGIGMGYTDCKHEFDQMAKDQSGQ